jgi:HEPN domain-containing protein
MTPDELRRDEARRWLVLAGKDLNSARLLTAEEPANSVFHIQQAAEKAAKAFLAFHNVPFRKTHDLKELGAQCIAVDSSLSSLLEEAANLTEYAVVFRYLDAPRELDDSEAAGALETARKVYEQVRAALAPGGEP